ncbi:hypothetical protein OF83DRAFT_1068415 [Amylostereum chailletii]|nr:hypothetical protein OF83DRAFT_1068415 [Amylostereum chailletii]
MASGSGKTNSRFSTFKVFKFAGSKAPPPPPKDTNYLYSASNPSVLSFSNQSLSIDSYSQPTTPHSTHLPPPFDIRSPSPAPSRATQSQSPALLSSGLSPETAGFRKNIFKFASLGKRSRSRSRPPPAEETADDESISLPWGFQVSVGLSPPPRWPFADAVRVT